MEHYGRTSFFSLSIYVPIMSGVVATFDSIEKSLACLGRHFSLALEDVCVMYLALNRLRRLSPLSSECCHARGSWKKKKINATGNEYDRNTG